jgi:hypothetical protein
LGREETVFRSGDADCAGWLYRPDAAGDSTSCVVLGHGFGSLKEARLLDVGRQHQDWRAAIAHARALEGVDPERIAVADQVDFLERHL